MPSAPQAEIFGNHGSFCLILHGFCTAVHVEQIESWAFWGEKIARFGLKILPRVSRAKRAEIFGDFLAQNRVFHRKVLKK